MVEVFSLRGVCGRLQKTTTYTTFYLDYGKLAYYRTIWLNGSVATNSNFLLDICVSHDNHLKMASYEGQNMSWS
jgi:hypothetical protein